MGVQLYRDPGQSLPPGPSSPGAPASARRNTPPPRTPPRPDGSPQLPTSINPITKSALPFSIENILRPDFGSLSPDKPAFLPYKPYPAFFQYSSPFTVFSNCITPLPQSPSPASLRPVDLSSTRITSANLSNLRKPTADIGGHRKSSVDLIVPRKRSGDHDSLSKAPGDITASGIKKPSANIPRKPSPDGDKKLAASDPPVDPEVLANPPLPAEDKMVWPAWVYCTRYSDRPSSGPRSRRTSKPKKVDEKRPRTAFSSEQLDRLTQEFNDNKYLSEDRRQRLSRELGLNESQIKIWFQNKRAKLKKTSSGQKPTLAMKLMEQGLYNHTTIAADEEERLLRLCQSQAM